MNKILNVTDFSKVLILPTFDDYVNRDRVNDQFTLYIVGDPSVENLDSCIVYYGDRRLTDLLVVSSFPSTLPEYPLNKLYLVLDKDSNNEYYIDKVYYKYLKNSRDPEIAEVSGKYFKNYRESSIGTADIILSDNDKVSLLVGDKDNDVSPLSSNTLDAILHGFHGYLGDTVKWQMW